LVAWRQVFDIPVQNTADVGSVIEVARTSNDYSACRGVYTQRQKHQPSRTHFWRWFVHARLRVIFRNALSSANDATRTTIMRYSSATAVYSVACSVFRNHKPYDVVSLLVVVDYTFETAFVTAVFGAVRCA